MELLISKGASVRVVAERGETVLFWSRSRRITEFLINSGADLYLKDRHGRSPLHWAANAGCGEVLEALIEYGLSVDDQTITGEMPLHMAANSEAASALIKHGAKVSGVDHAGRTALLTAAYMGRQDVVDLLEREQQRGQ